MSEKPATGETTPVTDALVQVSFAVLDVLNRSAAELDLSLTQLRLIGILRDRSPNMAALAEFLGLDRSSVSGLIDRAERRDLVVRRPSTDDARVTLIDLSPAGRKVGERIGELVNARMDELLNGIPVGDRDQIVRIAQRVLASDT
ncbi:MAG TPA: MarR family transcriptional regulator [Galbitalea sp.]|jgi:DNA-binding MarR family transcriptional regulator